MDAKKELIDQLKTMAGCCENELKVLLDGYCITREPVRERSNLKKQISAFLTAKKIDGLSHKTLKNYREIA